VLRNVARRDDDFGQRNIVVGNKDDLQDVRDVGVVVDNLCH
jgi:hypothetical protein